MRYIFGFILLFLSSCSGRQGSIKIKGSDTEVNLAVKLAESFRQVRPDLIVTVSGGGSGLGIASLLNNTCDIANSSRRINDEEIALFAKRQMAVDSFVFAVDAIAFVVAADLPIDSISAGELSKILSGEYTNWASITGKSMPVNIYGRQSNSGTYEFVKNKLQIAFSPHAKQMNGNAQILESIKYDASGIGYVGAGYLQSADEKVIKVLKISQGRSEAVSPLDTAMIAAGHYFFQRPLYQYYKRTALHQIQPFLAFEKTATGRAIIRSSGYYPVNE